MPESELISPQDPDLEVTMSNVQQFKKDHLGKTQWEWRTRRKQVTGLENENFQEPVISVWAMK